jgi:hypothetical protein
LVATTALENFISTCSDMKSPKLSQQHSRPSMLLSPPLIFAHTCIDSASPRLNRSSEVKGEEKESFDTRSNCVTWGALWIMWANFRWSRVAALISWDYFFPTDLESGGSVSTWEIAKEKSL